MRIGGIGLRGGRGLGRNFEKEVLEALDKRVIEYMG